MVAGVARVPGAAGRPAELRRFAGVVSPQRVERGKRNRAKTPSVAVSRTTTFNEVYDDNAVARAADRDQLAVQLGIMSSSRDGQPRHVKIAHAGGVAAGDPRIGVRGRLGLLVVRHPGTEKS